jgi:hypothetical protein
VLIGLAGYKGSGKDTVGDYLQEKYFFERRSFMDKMKESAAAAFNVNPILWDVWKNDPDAQVRLTTNSGKILTRTEPLTVRQFLQNYGSEAHRGIFGENFWIDHALKGIDPTARTVITDARLDTELAAISRYGDGDAFNIRIVRDGTKDGDNHSTEVAPSPTLIDYTIYNNGTIEELWDEIDKFLEWAQYDAIYAGATEYDDFFED